jgi:hypothetical protein
MTEQLDLLARVPQKKQPSRYPRDIARSAEIEQVGEDRYRWVAVRAWGSGPTIIWILLNPSTADGKVDDPTMRRMIRFSYRWGFGSLVVMNVYPIISSKPSIMNAWRRTFDHETWQDLGMPAWRTGVCRSSWSAFFENTRRISARIDDDSKVVAAWGAGVDPKDLDYFIAHVSRRVDTNEHDGFGDVGVPITWHCLGKNEDGSPTHPLARGKHWVPDEAELRVWKRPPRQSDDGGYA